MVKEAHLGLQPHNGLGYWDHRSLVFHRLGCSIRSILKNSHFSTCVLAISVEPVRLFLDLFYDKAELIFASCFCLHENVIKDHLPACLVAWLWAALGGQFFLLLGTAPCDRTTIFRPCFWFVSFLPWFVIIFLYCIVRRLFRNFTIWRLDKGASFEEVLFVIKLVWWLD